MFERRAASVDRIRGFNAKWCRVGSSGQLRGSQGRADQGHFRLGPNSLSSKWLICLIRIGQIVSILGSWIAFSSHGQRQSIFEDGRSHGPPKGMDSDFLTR